MADDLLGKDCIIYRIEQASAILIHDIIITTILLQLLAKESFSFLVDFSAFDEPSRTSVSCCCF